MLISDELFDAYLKCKTKAHLTFSQARVGEPSSPISDWQRHLAENYQADCRDRLQSGDCGDCFVGSPRSEDLRSATYRLIIQPYITAQDVGSNIHALERGTAPTQKRHSPYAPIRFFPFEKISKHHKLMLAFDAFVFWKASGQMPTKGTIIHGLQHTALGFKLDAWIHEVESLVGKLRALLTDGSPPDPVLIKHCSECVFEAPCRKKVTGARAVSPGGTKRHAQHPPLDFRVTIRLGRFADELIQSYNAQVNPPMRLPKGNKGPVYSTVYEFLSPEHVIKEFIDKW